MSEISARESDHIQAEILRVLLESQGKSLTITHLSRLTKIEKRDLRQAIKHLKESGVDISAGRQYSIDSLPDKILPSIIYCGLKSGTLGREIHSFKSIGSTNETARRLAESGSPEGTLVIAEKQTKGRGRLGRSWHSPSGTGLYFSLILRPKIPYSRLPALSLVAALSISRTLNKISGSDIRIKWPNDCLLSNRKIAGILVEMSAELDRVSYVILGIGINVNTPKSDFPLRLRSKATSLAVETGKTHSRGDILRGLLQDLEKSYKNFCSYGLRFIAPELVKRSAVIGREITFSLGKKKYAGRALGFDENGGLRVRTGDGVRTLAAGEITLRK